jgi:hypothetical protein
LRIRFLFFLEGEKITSLRPNEVACQNELKTMLDRDVIELLGGFLAITLFAIALVLIQQ